MLVENNTGVRQSYEGVEYSCVEECSKSRCCNLPLFGVYVYTLPMFVHFTCLTLLVANQGALRSCLTIKSIEYWSGSSSIIIQTTILSLACFFKYCYNREAKQVFKTYDEWEISAIQSAKCNYDATIYVTAAALIASVASVVFIQLQCYNA